MGFLGLFLSLFRLSEAARDAKVPHSSSGSYSLLNDMSVFFPLPVFSSAPPDVSRVIGVRQVLHSAIQVERSVLFLPLHESSLSSDPVRKAPTSMG